MTGVCWVVHNAHRQPVGPHHPDRPAAQEALGQVGYWVAPVTCPGHTPPADPAKWHPPGEPHTVCQGHPAVTLTYLKVEYGPEPALSVRCCVCGLWHRSGTTAHGAGEWRCSPWP